MTHKNAKGSPRAPCLLTSWVFVLLCWAVLAPRAWAQAPDDPAVFPTRVYQAQAASDAQWRASVVAVPRDIVAPFTLRIANGTQGGAGRATNVRIRINGIEVVSPADFATSPPSLERLLVLNPGDNTLEVRVDGTGGELLALSISGTRTVSQPSVIRPETPAIAVGGTGTLEVRLTPQAASDGVLTVSTSDATVARVPSSVPYSAGTSVVSVPVTGAGVGSATVTVSGNGGAVTRTVSVVRESARPLRLDLPRGPLRAGTSITGEIRLSAAASADVVVSLLSSSPSVASVAASAIVPAGRTTAPFRIDAVAPGVSTVSAQVGTSSVRTAVAVSPAPALALSVTPSSSGIELGGHGSLVLRVSPPQAQPVPVTLSAEPAGVLGVPSRVELPAGASELSVSLRGERTGLAVVSAAAPDAAAETSLQVGPSQARLTRFSFAAGTLARGSVTRATLMVPVAQTTNTDILLSASPAGVVGIPSRVVLPAGHRQVSFEVRALGNGSAIVRAATPGGGLDAHVSVADSVAPAFAWLKPAAVLQTGAHAQFTLHLPGAPADGTTIALSASGTGTVEFPAEVPLPAGATSTTVTVAARTPGELTLRAVSGGAVALTRLRIEDAPAGAGAFDPSALRLPKGRVETVALALDRVSTTPVTALLSSSDASVVAVPARIVVPAGALSADVPVRALGTGVATIRATVGGTAVTTAVEVAPAELDNLTVAPMTGALYVGDTRTLSLRGTLSDGSATAPASGVTWQTSDASVATVSAEGVVVAVGTGAVRITAFASGLMTQAAFTVARRPALTLSPGTATFPRGSGRTFTVDAGSTVSGTPLEVVITQSGAGRVTAPPVVTIPVGRASATFTVTGEVEGVLLLRASATGFASVSSAVEITAPAPTITGFSPARAPAGGSVVITGDGFAPSMLGNRVTIGGIDAIVTSATTTRLVVLVPAGITRGVIAIQNANGAASGGELVVETANALGQTANVILTADGQLTTTRGVFTPVTGAYLAQGTTILVGSGSPNDKVTYLPQTSAGTYKVFAWWPRTSEKTGKADIVVTHKGGTSLLTVDQSQGGGVWQYVGAFEASAARTLRVELRGRPGYSLIADAVRFEYAPGAALGVAPSGTDTAIASTAATATNAATEPATTLAPPSPTSTAPALSELLSMIAEIPEGSWVRANANPYNEVWSPTDLIPYYYAQNPSSPASIIMPWSSFAWDTNRGDLYLFGGGHANYAGNDVYRWRGTTRRWERLSLPSEITQDALGNYMAVDGPNNAPPSAHTYDNNIYLPGIDRFVVFGGAAYNNGGRWEMQVSGTTERPYGPFFFDQSKADANKVGGTTGSHVQRNSAYSGIVGGNMWENRDIFVNIPGGVNTEGVFRDGCNANHQIGGKDVVYIAQTPAHGTGYRLYEYVINDVANPALDTWRWIGREPFGSPGPFGNTACGFDPHLNLLVRRGDPARPFVYWDIGQASEGNIEVNVVPSDPTGEFATFLTSAPPADSIGITNPMMACGFDFDPVRRQHLMWCGDGNVWVLTPPATVSPSGWVIRKQAPTGGTATPNGSVRTGILGKWKYAANLDAFIGLQDENLGNIWIYKPIGWQPPAPFNRRPSVTLTQPATGLSVTRPANVTMAATATDPDGTVARVEFYANGTKVGEDASAPYEYTWVIPPAGTYTIVARAIDNQGLHRDSDTASVTVNPAATNPPTVRIVRPSSQQQVTVGVPVTIDVAASDTDGSIARVEFYAGTTKIGEDTTAPFQLAWTPGAAGAHTLTAVATDNAYGVATSIPVTVTAVNTSFTTVTFQNGFDGYSGTSDTFMYDANPLGNFGNQPYLQIGQSQFDNLIRFAIFQSEGGPVPDGAVITSARLHLYKSSYYDATYRLHRLLQNWDEATVTFNQRTTGQSWTSPGARGAGTDYATTFDAQGFGGWEPGWIEFDVTSGVQQLAVNPTGNFGWKILMASGNGNIKAYHSSEYATEPDLRPRLVVSYQPPTGPQVTITSPAPGTTVNQPANIAITANALDGSGGTITKVEFFASGTRLGEDTTAPYAFAWNGVAPGTYALTAVATNNTGATRTSAPVSITVKGPNVGPAVSITQPVTGVQVTSGAVVNLIAAASDADGTVTRVEFYQGATKIAEDLIAPYTASWIAPIQTGTYSFTAVATDELGATTTSMPVVVTVNAPTGSAITTTLQEGLGNYAGTRDTYIYDFSPEANYGSLPNLLIGASQFENLIRFAIFQSEGGPIPDGATINAATLSIYKESFYDATYRVHRLLQSWDENTATFNARSSGLPWTVPGARGSGTDFLAAHDAEKTLGWDPGWLDLDVTTAVQAFGSGASLNHGWKLVMASGNGNIKGFASSEYTVDPALRPRLLITYTPAGPQVALTAPSNGATFTAPANIALAATATDSSGGTITKVEFFAGATKVGEDTSSPYTLDWTNVGAGSYAITAVATNNTGTTRTSPAVNVTVNAPNTPPTVSITSPVGGTSIPGGTTVTIQATAADNNGSVTRVEFYAGATKIGEDTTSPYSISWTAPGAAGGVTLTAVATDNAGAQTTSQPVSVTVSAANAAPTVNITSPASGASVAPGSTVPITANASDSDGTVTRVEFYAGTTKIGEDTSSPYSISWTAPTNAGPVSLTAVATDNSGAQTTSAVVPVTITAPNAPPTVAITAPASGNSITAGSSVTVQATATDGDGSVTRVEFFAGTTKIGEDATAPYSISWTAPTASGGVNLTAVATDNAGAQTTSPVIPVTVVTANTPPTVNITTPVGGATVTAGTTVSVAANAADNDGTIARVEFYQGTTKIGEATSTPYAVAWTVPAAPGPVSLTAVAVDNGGAQTTSAVVSVSVVSGSGGGGTVTLQDGLTGYTGTRDAHLYIYWPTINLGNATTLLIGQNQYQNLIRFAIFQSEGGPVPDGASITSARLSLYKSTNAYEGTYRAHRVLQNWDESQVTWNSRATGLPWTSPGANGLNTDILSVHDGQATLGWNAGWLEIDVTPGVQAFSAGSAANHGWKVIMSSGNGNLKGFNSSEFIGDPALRPKLVVTYAQLTGPQVALASPAGGATFTAPATISLTANASDASGGTITKVEYFANGAKVGEASSAPWTAAWTNVPAASYSLTAVATNDSGATRTSAPVAITVSAPNTPPSVTLTSPASASAFTGGTAVSLAATASDTDGTVQRVEFYAGTTKLGEDASSPYTLTWTAPLTVGPVTLTAVAIDNAGAQTTSGAVTVNITAPNTPPTAVLTSPASATSVTAGSPVALAATAGDADGSVVRVEFFAGTTKIGEDTSSPYTLAWTAPSTTGPVSLTAVAVDNAGARTTSAAVTLTVTAGNSPPSVAITTPGTGAMVVAGSTIGVSAQATDTGGSVTRVEFYVGSTKIGEATSTPYSVNWTAPPTAGSYVLTAVAFDNAGASTTSAGVSVSVISSGGASITLQEGLNGYSGTRDAYLYIYWPTINIGGDATLKIGQNQFENLLRFAIFQSEGGPVPNGATITSARLGLYKFTDAYEGTYRAFRLLQSWDESQVTWNSRATGLPWAAPGARGSGTDFLAAHDAQATLGWNAGWLELDVTSAVQAFSVGSAVNNGWKIVMSSGNGNIKAFHSSEAATASAGLRPRLIITYSVGP